MPLVAKVLTVSDRVVAGTRYDVSARTVVLTPADPAEGWRVTYERV